MNRELRKRAFAIAESAIEKSDEEREPWLKTTCGDDLTLFQEVNAILAADRTGTGLAQASIAMATSAEDFVGKVLGRYRITEVLGEGGMGIVFKGERIGDFEQVVAIKIARQGLDTGSARARFDLERDALARIEHPYIARLIDAGVDEQDRPYFVMEYADGIRLDAFLAQHELSLRERLELFKKICDAVAAAHRMLVIHRDIKPSNVHVTPDLHPKLLDFGISKLATDDRRAELTRDGAQLFTPEYASPEQIVGGNITTAVDVYGLGALLYFMLSGNRPFGSRTGTLFEYLQWTLENEPVLPSAAIQQHERGDPRNRANEKLRRGVRGDVDNITLRALRKDPGERYESVADFAEDVQRFLDGEAVLAKRPTVAYRLSKLVRRHWAETSLAASLLVALIGGFAASVWQANVASFERDQADARFDETRSLVNYMMNDLYPGLENVPGGSGLRVSISATAQEYLDGLSATRPEDPLLLIETAQGYRQLADMQGAPQEVSLNQPELAEESYGKALKLLDQAAARSNRGDDAIRLRIAEERARTSLKRARLVFFYSYTADWAMFSGQAVSEAQSLVEGKNDFDSWLNLIDAQLLDADVAVYVDDWSHAEAVLNQIVDNLDTKEDEWTPSQRRHWESARMRALATQADLYFHQDRFDEALASANAMIGAVSRLRSVDPANIALRRAAWVARQKAAESQAGLAQNEAAIVILNEALSIATAVYEADPGDAHAEMVADTNRLIGTAYSKMDRHTQAIAFSQKAVDYYRQASRDSADRVRSWRLLADARRAYAVILESAGFHDEACAEWRLAQPLVDRLARASALTDSRDLEEFVTPIKAGVERCN